MTQAHQARDQQTVQAQRIITALLAALPVIEERRP